MSDLSHEILALLREILPAEAALHIPEFNGREWEYVKDCLDTGWVSSAGSYVSEFEKHLSSYIGVRHAVVVVNGTAALHICLKLAGVQAEDEVLLPSLTFVATANAVRYCHAIPHFVDVEMETLGVDPDKLASYLNDNALVNKDSCYNKKTSRRMKGLIVMHAFGHPVDLDPIKEICAAYRIALIEDATESLGSFYKGRHTGRFGKVSALSFNGNKIITTGGGGAVLTDDEALARSAKHLTTTAKLSHPWESEHDETGYNYRLPNLNAALGCAQLEQLDGFLQRKRSLALSYQQKFEHLEGVRFFQEPSFAKSNYWLNVLILDEDKQKERDEILKVTIAAGIMTRPAWKPMHQLKMYTDYPRMDMSVTENLSRRLICIPSSASLWASPLSLLGLRGGEKS